MELKQTVFGSKSEKAAFRTIESRWSPPFHIFLSLPFANLIKINAHELSNQEQNFFYKTSVDFTLCKSDGFPLLSIEFDGMGNGFSKDREYKPASKSIDSNRKKKLDFKLKIAKAVGYPWIIISYPEVEPFDKDDSLTICDGIIGQILSKKQETKIRQKFLEESQDEIAQLSEDEKYDFYEDLILSAEVKAEMETNPIIRKAEEYNTLCNKIRGISWDIKWLSDPLLPENGSIFDINGLEARLEAIKQVERVGCQVDVRIKDIKRTITGIAWMRNFDGWDISTASLTHNIANI